MEVRKIAPELTHPIRHLVLWPHLEADNCAIHVDTLETTFHLGTLVDEQVVSIATFLKEENDKFSEENQYRLRAMATHPDHRGKNAGGLIVQEAIKMLRNDEIDLLWCDARIGAVDFYLKQGFDLIDQVYEVPKIGPHKLMFYRF